MPKRKYTNTTGYRGVDKRGKRFRAQICFDRKLACLGTFDTSKEAAEAYDRAAIQAGRPTSTLNFLDQVPKNYKVKKQPLHSIHKMKKLKSDSMIVRIEQNHKIYFMVDEMRGVQKRGEKFQAKIMIDYENHSLGTFDTLKEAVEVYDHAAIQAGRPISELNFLDQVPKNYKPKKKKLKSNNTTGFRGVYKCTRDRFQAQIRIDGKQQYIGMFGTAKKAAIAYDLAAIQAKRPASDLNFPDMIIHVKKEIPKIKKRKLTKSSNETRYKKVSKIGKKLKKFRARIYFDGKGQHLGSFAKTRDAAMAYKHGDC